MNSDFKALGISLIVVVGIVVGYTIFGP